VTGRVEPVKVGLLIDYIEGTGGSDSMLEGIVLAAFRIAEDELRAARLLDRDVEYVIEQANGLPNGSFKPVRDAFYRLVDAGCVIIFGPWISENGAPLGEYVNGLGEVPCITVAGTESMLGEYMFGLPAGSMEEEPIIMAHVAWYDGCRTMGIAYEDSLIGEQYLRTARAACANLGIEITGEVAIPQIVATKIDDLRLLHANQPDGLMHIGMGLGIQHINEGLRQIGWMPRRYTCTAFEFAANSAMWREHLAGWVGLDQFDERNQVGREFLDRFEARHGRRPAFYWPLLAYDVGRMMLTAVATARPLTGKGVKAALEKIKMMPAATGAPGTRMRFGRFIRHGWIGGEFLVARRVLDDASGIVMHGTINGLVAPWEPAKGEKVMGINDD
jgi:branched-chain amino acid transport system substrate-binding protein